MKSALIDIIKYEQDSSLRLRLRLLLHSDSIHCYKRQTIKYTIHDDELNE